MTLYRLAIKGFDSDALMGGRCGHVIAAFPMDYGFGVRGEKDFFGLAVDLPADHPLVQNLGSPVKAKDGAKSRYSIDWKAAGISGATLAVIRDRTRRSPWKPTKIVTSEVLQDRDAR